MAGYVHGYSRREATRLDDQTAFLRPLLHHDSAFPAGSAVLEAGCGTGAATAALLANSPDLRLTGLDLSAEQLRLARRRLRRLGLDAEFVQADLAAAPFPDAAFDHAFACFLLEHLPSPPAALRALHRLVRPGGSIMLIEGDHGSARFHPQTPAARAVCDAFDAAQRALGGDPTIGRRLYGLLAQAGFVEVQVSPRLVYADAASPELRAGFVRRIFTPMMAGARGAALAAGFDPALWRQGIADLLAADADEQGVICYCFFKATARRPQER